MFQTSIIRNQWLLLQQQRCHFATTCSKYGKKYRLSPKVAVKMIKDLSKEERALLAEALQQVEEKKINNAETIPQPSWVELRKLSLHQSLPFIGFGFLDNLIMILAGEFIELKIGATFAISTMAAAALGNTISDVFGVGSAWYVESVASKFGANPPNLTLEQLDLTSCRIASNGGRALGVAFGCVLGMFPLLFYKETTEDTTKETNNEEKQ